MRAIEQVQTQDRWIGGAEMTHSKFPWTNHPHTPTAVFDGDGRRIIDQWVAPEGWPPIETAPKDGSEILVWRPHENSDHPAHIGIDLWKMYDSKGVWWRSRPGQFPTHWRPLPTPPSSAPAPTPLDPDTAAANAVMIAGLPGLIEALEASKYTLEKIGRKTDWDTSEAVARINSALSSARKE